MLTKGFVVLHDVAGLSLQVVQILLDILERPDHCLPLHGEESVQIFEILGHSVLALFVYLHESFHLRQPRFQELVLLAQCTVGCSRAACRLDSAHPIGQPIDARLDACMDLVVRQDEIRVILLRQIQQTDGFL